MEVGLVRSIDIDREMQQAYLDYAMSVIISRALPDARDGLKPVHRRILYAMYDMGMRPETPYKKSARIVGEVLGKYHPHGDMAVYEAMARMAQPFSLRTLLIDGQGNFGSVDGDPPAAMRYTEARLAQAAMQMLTDIQKNTVDFSANFDGTLTEPDVLPAALPNLLVNGATGIAVGMSTSIPPHNLGEVVDALVYILQRWEQIDDISVDELMGCIQGPDFPTGGIIFTRNDQEGLKSAYGTGRGKVTVQARAHIEEMSRGRNRIIVTELPYMTNKASLIERIAELVRDERLDGVADLRDESDRQGLRVVIELNKNANPTKVLQDLFKSTSMRTTFGIIMLALVDGEPRMLSLKQALRVYLDHRLEIVRRRGEHDLARARQRAHILEGLRVALKFLDEVIALIRKAPDAETARTRLIKQFKLSEIQAQAILDLPLRRLAALERRKIEDEYKELVALIKSLESLLRSPKKIREVVAEELLAVKEAFADRRRTQIIHRAEGEVGEMTLIASNLSAEQHVWVTATGEGLVSRSLSDTPPSVGGSAAPRWAVRVSTRDTLYLVSEQGDAAGLPVHAIPENTDLSAGVPAHKISALSDQDRLAGMFSLPPKEERLEGTFVISGTRRGFVKKTAASELPGATAKTFCLMKVNEGDRFSWTRLSNGSAEILLATRDGMAIRFSEEDVRPMGLGAAGVGGIKLQAQDEVVGGDLFPEKGEVMLIASNGKGKRISAEQFPRQSRYGQGVVAWKMVRPASLVGMAAAARPGPASPLTLHLDKKTPRLLRWDDVPVQTRAAAGKSILDLKSGDLILHSTALYDLGREPLSPDTPADEPELPRQKPLPLPAIPKKPARAAAPKKAAAAGPGKSAPAEKKAPGKTQKAASGPASARPPVEMNGKQAAGKGKIAAKKAPSRAADAAASEGAGKAGKTAARKPAAEKAAPPAEKPAAKKTRTTGKAEEGSKTPPAKKAPAKKTPTAGKGKAGAEKEEKPAARASKTPPKPASPAPEKPSRTPRKKP